MPRGYPPGECHTGASTTPTSGDTEASDCPANSAAKPEDSSGCVWTTLEAPGGRHPVRAVTSGFAGTTVDGLDSLRTAEVIAGAIPRATRGGYVWAPSVA